MSLGLKHWLGIVAVGVALALILALPPTSIARPFHRAKRFTEEAQLLALRREGARLEGELRITRYMKAFLPAALEAFPDIAVRGSRRMSAEEVDEVRGRIGRELARGRVAAGGVALGVFFVDEGEMVYPGLPWGRIKAQEFYWGRQDGRTYCFTVAAVHPASLSSPAAQVPGARSILGTCELVAKYGLPGPTVARWLSSGGMSLAGTAVPSLPNDRHSYLAGRGRRGPYGRLTTLGVTRDNLALDECWTGAEAGCGELVEHPRPAGFPGDAYADLVSYLIPRTGLSAVDQPSVPGPFTYHLAADLARRFGDDRFERFWKTSEPFQDGFLEAFGTDLDGWALRRASTSLEVSRPGPDVTLDAKISTLLMLALSAIIGGAWARSRRVN